MTGLTCRRWLLGSLVLMLVSARSATATTENGKDIEAARLAYNEAVALSKQGEMESALSLFERAYALGRHPTVLFNIGQLQFSLGQLVKAKESLERFVNSAGVTDDGDRARQAERTLQYLRRHIGTIRFNVEPSDARVFVDGVQMDPATRSVQALIGPHAVTASREKYQDEVRVTEVSPGQSVTVELKLTPAPSPMGWLKFSCELPNVAIRLDDMWLSNDALVQPVPVTTGAHVVRFERAGSPPGQYSVSVDTGKLLDVGCGPTQGHVDALPTEQRRARSNTIAHRERLVAYSAGAAGLALDLGALVAYLWNNNRHSAWQRDRDAVAAGNTAEWSHLAERAAAIQRVDDLALAGAVMGTALVTVSVYYLLESGRTFKSAASGAQRTRPATGWQW